MGLAEMLAEMGRDGDDYAKILPEAAVMRLQEAADRYAEQLTGPRFKVGQLVTPALGGDIKNAGDPHVVIEIRSNAEPDFSLGEVGSNIRALPGAGLMTRLGFSREEHVSMFVRALAVCPDIGDNAAVMAHIHRLGLSVASIGATAFDALLDEARTASRDLTPST